MPGHMGDILYSYQLQLLLFLIIQPVWNNLHPGGFQINILETEEQELS